MTRPTLAVVVLVAVLVAGCGLSDPTTTPGPTPPPAGEAPTTATTPAGTTYAPNPAGEPADDCPLDTVECPRPWVTPGAVIPSTAGVCQASFNPRRELTAAAKRRVLQAYGIPADAKPVEWDHYVPRWAGGTSTSRNIWPEFDPAGKARKDALEASLYRAVCVSRTMTLAEARHRAARFWAWWPARFSSVRGGGHD